MKVASYQSFKYMLPAPSRFENWRGVYYPARMSPQSFLQRQREYQTEIAGQKEKFTRDLQNTESTIQTFLASCASDQPNNAGPKSEWSLYQLMCQANDFALTNLAMECFDLLPSVCASTTPAYASPSVDLKTTLRTNSTTVTLPHHAYPSLVQSFTAKSVANFLYHSETHHDTLETIKKLGEWSGPQRVDEACFVIEVCEALWKRKHLGVQGADHVLRVQCWNALMDVMMTGGYHACRRVSGEVYDEMGRLGLQPTAETYLRLIRSLGLIGEVEEAESVFRWLTQRIGANTGWDAGAIRPYNALLEVYKENRLLEKSDRLWSRLIDARFPRINLTTVETYLRTLIDAAYTPLAGNISLFGNPLHSELKRIPLILQSAAEHGVAHEMLSPTLARHISNAFISYKIPVSMKYRWSRSDIQFKFLQMRKDAQYGDDVKELMDPQLPADSTEAPLPVPGARQVPSSTADYYGVYHKKNSWESLPADELFYQHTLEDRMEDTRMDSKVHVKRRYHWERSPNWMSENPPTRYDALYGSSKIPLESMGIRRHLSGDPGRPGLEVHVERDNVIVSSAIRAGRKFFRGTQSKGSTSTQQYYQDFVDT